MNEGAQFLHHKFPDLHKSRPVEQAATPKESRPAERIDAWMEVLTQTHLGHRDRTEVLDRIKSHYHKQYVIKPENIPQAHFDARRRLLREQGHGDVEVTGQMREEAAANIIADQKSSLDTWIDYQISQDADAYPMWVKYWAFKGMLKLSTFDKRSHSFAKRTRTTVAPFVDLNREALAYVFDAVIRRARRTEIPADELNPEFDALHEGANFGKLYAYAFEKAVPAVQERLESTAGQWRVFGRGTDYMQLVQSLQGHGTGWCTAGESIAEIQMKQGDFHVYYTCDRNGAPTVPRVAIRMEGNCIAEVRGIGSGQNVDAEIAGSGIVDDKLQEFGTEGERYRKRSADMKRLTAIEERHRTRSPLAIDDLRFLYELDGKIDGFGYSRDPRIDEIASSRDVKGDLALVLSCELDQISLTKEEALGGSIAFHYGNLDLGKLTSAAGLEIPQSVGGNLNLRSLVSAEGLKLPQSVGGSLYLSNLINAEGLRLPQSIGGDLDLGKLTSAVGVDIPQSAGGYLNLRSLVSAEGLKLPQNVGGSLYLSKLINAEGLRLPQSVGGDLDLGKLTNAVRLETPRSVGGDLDLRSLSSSKGLKLPEELLGWLYLGDCTNASGVKR